jgi:hypothetical protein
MFRMFSRGIAGRKALADLGWYARRGLVGFTLTDVDENEFVDGNVFRLGVTRILSQSGALSDGREER